MFTNFIIPAYSVFHEGWNRGNFTEVTAPKSNESTNSTTSAYASIFTRGGGPGRSIALDPHSAFYHEETLLSIETMSVKLKMRVSYVICTNFYTFALDILDEA